MISSCREVQDRLEAYTAEALAAGERRLVREHLGKCEPCRREAVASDASLFFARDGVETVSSEESARILSAVRTGILLKSAERRLETASTRRRVGALASAAAALAFTLLAPGAPARRSSVSVPAVKATFAPAAVSFPGEAGFAKAGKEKTYPADATIYDWNPGDGQPRVVWIVDRSIDI